MVGLICQLAIGHGVLLTNSRQSAVNIIRAHSKLVKPHQKGEYLCPSGVYALQEALSDENPAKALGYRASIVGITRPKSTGRGYLRSQL